MAGIPSLPSRSALACAISSAVLVVVSVFWFRKKRKIKELPVLGPSEDLQEVSVPHCEKTTTQLENSSCEKSVSGETDVQLPVGSQDTLVTTICSLPNNCSITSGIGSIDSQWENDDTMQMKSFTHNDSNTDTPVGPTYADYAKQSYVSLLESEVKEEVVSKTLVNDSCSGTENLASSAVEYSENLDTKSNNLIKGMCLDVTCSNVTVCDEVRNDEISTNFINERNLLGQLSETHLISNNSSSSNYEEIIDSNDELLEPSMSKNVALDCENIAAVKQSDLSLTKDIEFENFNSMQDEMLSCEETECTVKLLDSSLQNVRPLPKRVVESVADLPVICSVEHSDSKYSMDISKQVSSPEILSLESSVSDKVEETVEVVVSELDKSSSIVINENEKQVVVNCEIDKIGQSNPEITHDCVEEFVNDVRIGVKEAVNHLEVLNGSGDCAPTKESTLGFLNEETISRTESITIDGSNNHSELGAEPQSPEWMPEDKSRSSATVSSSVSLSDSAPLSPTLTVDEEFTSLDDASKGASTELEKLRTRESTDCSESGTTNVTSSERCEKDHLDNVIVPSGSVVTNLSESCSGISSPQPVIPTSISNGNLTVGSHSIERHLSSSPSHILNHAEVRSEDSPDSGKGSDVNTVNDVKPLNTSNYFIYEFELPQELCGRLIGKQGKYVKYIKERSSSNVLIKRHPFNPQMKLVVVEGSRSDVNNALELIRKKFPPSQFPNVSLAQTHILGSLNVPAVPESSQLHLPDNGVSCDVILSSLVNAGHFFLQQPTHPTYPSLSTLDQCMMACYSQMETPRLPQPVEAGVICAATIMNGWYRAQIVFVYESGEECDIKFVDYGGFSQVLVSSLRQIRSDFMTLPFQASECYLANVVPHSEELGWTQDASATFEELAQGQILQAVVVNYAEDGIPYVELYRVQGITSTFINQELVDLGVAKWVASH